MTGDWGWAHAGVQAALADLTEATGAVARDYAGHP